MEEKLQQRARVIWLSGLPCSGKTTIGLGIERELINRGFHVRMLDGDITRKGICNDLGFSENDRKENIRRVAEISKLFAESGLITINAFITPTEQLRKLAGNIIGLQHLSHIFIDTPLKICEQRDVKGMYKKARNGEIQNFTGISALFEDHAKADFRINTTGRGPDECINELLAYILPLIRFTK